MQSTDANVADPLTKSLLQPKHDSHEAAVGFKRIGEWFNPFERCWF